MPAGARGWSIGLGVSRPTGRMGRHEPPTNRSFYLSVAASTLRFAIIIALIVGGVVLIDQAFPEPSGGGGTGTIPDGGGTIGETGATGATGESGATGATGETGQPTPTATVAGTSIAVFNGTGVTGLAGDTQTQLIDAYGYVAPVEPGNAPETMAVTTIYYRAAKDRIEAEFLRTEFFGELEDVRVKKLPPETDLDSSIQLAIYIGQDYAATLPGG